MLDTEQGKTLLRLARAAIAGEFDLTSPDLEKHDTPATDWLAKPGATFVTLTQHGQLRGCIGSLEAHRALIDDVRHNAVSAAFEDPRFEPLSQQEFAAVRIEVSLLSKPEPMHFNDEPDALAQLRPGVDGVVFEYGNYRSTFLPQVWESLAQPRLFIAQLKRKAGLPDNFWAEGVKLSRYTVTKWSEPEKP